MSRSSFRDETAFPAADDPQIQTAVTALQRQGANVKQMPGTSPAGTRRNPRKD